MRLAALKGSIVAASDISEKPSTTSRWITRYIPRRMTGHGDRLIISGSVLLAANPARSCPVPNLVLFMADQLRADALGCLGNPLARTPTLEATAVLLGRPYCATGWRPASMAKIDTMTRTIPRACNG